MFVVFLDHYTVTIAIMKTIATAIFFLSFNYLSAQQNIFEVTTKGSKYNLTEIEKAFNSADWCRFVYENQRHELKFDDGTVVQLLAYDEIQQRQISFDPSCVESYKSKDIATYKLVDGIVVRMAMKPIQIRQ